MPSSSSPPVAWPFQLAALFFAFTTLGIVLFTLYAAFHYSSNAMLGRDEANFILLSSEKMLGTTSWHEKISALFVNHGQHVLFGMQLINLLTYFTVGTLDRRIMNVIGVAILSAAALFVPGQRRRPLPEVLLLYAAIFPLILSPAHNACIINASCTGNHYFGIAFSVFSLYFFSRCAEKISWFVWAEVALFLAIFSLSTALALIPVSFLVLWRSTSAHRKHFLAFHTAYILLLMILQLKLTYPETIFSFVQESHGVSAIDALTHLTTFCLTAFIILASLFYWLNDTGYTWLLIFFGAVFFVGLMVLFWKAYRQQKFSYHFYGIVLFFLMIVLIAFGRYYSFGSSRYAAYTSFLFAFLIVGLFQRDEQTMDIQATARCFRALTVTASLSLAYYALALHYHQPYLDALGQKDQLCKQMWVTDHYVCGVMIKHEEATRITKEAIEMGIYRVEP